MLRIVILFLILYDGVAPLMIACQNGHADVVEILLEGKANVDLPTNVSGRFGICVASSD